MVLRSSGSSLTEGSIWKSMLLFALPVFLGNVFQQLYNTFDSWVVGNYLGDNALAAVSSSGSLIFMMIGFFNGVAMGAGVIIARCYGAKDYDSMRRAIDETRRRRDIQMAYNEEHGIKPQTIRKAINDIMGFITEDVEGTTAEQVNKELAELSREEVLRLISSMEDDMAAASRDMDFEEAARLRDQVVKLKSTVEDKSEEDVLKDLKKGARKGSAYGNRKHAAYGSSRAS